jgi:hypothetical protein
MVHTLFNAGGGTASRAANRRVVTPPTQGAGTFAARPARRTPRA